MKSMYFKKALIASMFLIFASSSSAHGAYYQVKAGEPTVVYGHGGHDDKYKAAKVTFVEGYDAQNSVVAIDKKPTDKNVTLSVPDNASYLAIVLDNGYWTKNTAGKWKNVPKTEVENAETGGHYIKNAIAVLSSDADVKPVEALNLQIIPRENPLKKKAGDKLTIQVLLDGKPLPNVEIVRDFVNMSHEKDIKTDDKGEATLVIRNQGLNVISANYVEKLNSDPKADENGYVSTLSFTLEHLDEE